MAWHGIGIVGRREERIKQHPPPERTPVFSSYADLFPALSLPEFSVLFFSFLPLLLSVPFVPGISKRERERAYVVHSLLGKDLPHLSSLVVVVSTKDAIIEQSFAFPEHREMNCLLLTYFSLSLLFSSCQRMQKHTGREGGRRRERRRREANNSSVFSRLWDKNPVEFGWK